MATTADIQIEQIVGFLFDGVASNFRDEEMRSIGLYLLDTNPWFRVNESNAKTQFQMRFDYYLKQMRDARTIADYAARRHRLLNQDALRFHGTLYSNMASTKTGYVLETETTSFVYLLESNGLYKIGVTNNLTKRIHALRVGNPRPIKLVGYTFGTDKIEEKELHKHFQTQRVSGEWFKLSRNDVATVRSWFADGIPTIIE